MAVLADKQRQWSINVQRPDVNLTNIFVQTMPT